MNRLRKSIEQENIAPYFISWNRLEEELHLLFGNKGNRPAANMEKAIALYKALLEQCNVVPDKIEPLNNSERLTFVEDNASSYAAFRQLQELFNEMQKKIAAKRAILNK